MQPEKRLSQLDQLVPDNFDQPKEVYRIGDLAREFNVTLRTLRFYEDRGLLNPERSGSTRLYSQEERSRLKIILLAKRVGFSLVEIQEIMDIHDREDAGVQDYRKIASKFRSQMDVLKAQKAELEQSIEDLSETIEFLEDF